MRSDGAVVSRELLALRANPFWFGHDLYAPPTAMEGGPFTIGRVIHMSRNVGFTGYVGGVAVFGRALSKNQIKRVMAIGHSGSPVIRLQDAEIGIAGKPTSN